MLFYFFIPIVRRIVTKHMDLPIIRIGFLDFLEKANRRLRIQCLILLDHDIMRDHIDASRKIEPCASSISGNLFAHPFFDPPIGRLYIMRRMYTVDKTDGFVCRQSLSQSLVFGQPLLLLFFDVLYSSM